MTTYIFYHLKLTPEQSTQRKQVLSVRIRGHRYTLKVVRPTYQNSGGKNFLHLFIWNVLSFFRFKEYQLIDRKGKIVSYAQLMPKIFIFSFMSKQGLHIGPCYTDEKQRGRGLYPELLKMIIQNEIKNDEFFIFTKKTNIASQKGIIKAGFVPFGYGYKSKLGIYRISKMSIRSLKI